MKAWLLTCQEVDMTGDNRKGKKQKSRLLTELISKAPSLFSLDRAKSC